MQGLDAARRAVLGNGKWRRRTYFRGARLFQSLGGVAQEGRRRASPRQPAAHAATTAAASPPAACTLRALFVAFFFYIFSRRHSFPERRYSLLAGPLASGAAAFTGRLPQRFR